MSIGILTKMTPSQKAKDLVNIYRDNILSFLNDRMKHENAKKCALIAVDEILNNFGTLTEGKQHYAAHCTIKFYEEVKKEIEKL